MVADERVVRLRRSSDRMNGPAWDVMASSVLVGIEIAAAVDGTGRNELRIGDVAADPSTGGRFANGRAERDGQSSPSYTRESHDLDTRLSRISSRRPPTSPDQRSALRVLASSWLG